MEDKEIIRRLENGDVRVLEQVNKKYRSRFILWADHYFTHNLSRKLLEDVFQEILLILYKNIAGGKMEKLSSSLKTYIFSIGRNIIREELRKQRRMEYETPDIFEEPFSEDDWEDAKLLIRITVEEMVEPCRTILQKHLDEKSLDEITEEMKYPSKNYTAVRKTRCLNQLKTKLQEKIRKSSELPKIPERKLEQIWEGLIDGDLQDDYLNAWSYEIKLMRKLVNQMEEPCKELLGKIIYEEKSGKSLMEAMQFESRQQTYHMKWKCLQKLKHAMFKTLRDKEINDT